MSIKWKQPNRCGECPCYIAHKMSFTGHCGLTPDNPYRVSTQSPCKLIQFIFLILNLLEVPDA